MKINSKIIAFIIAVSLIIIVIGNVIFGIFFKTYLLEQEKEQIKTNVQNISSYLGSIKLRYETLASDWGHWDETYNFINKNDSEYINKNLSGDSLSEIQTNLMVFYNNENDIIFKTNYDLEKEVYLPFPENLLPKFEVIIKSNKKILIVSDIIKNGDNYYIISISESTNSLRNKPSNGRLLVGKLIDKSMISELEKNTNSKIMFSLKSDIKLDVSNELAKSLLVDNTSYSTIISEDKYEFTTNIFSSNDIFTDKSPFVISMTKQRDTYLFGMNRLFFIQITYSIFILIIILLLLWFLRVFITNPIYKLSEALYKIDIDKDVFSRLPINTKNEISIISIAINNMFDKIESQQENLKDSENRLIAAQQMAHVGNWELDLETNQIWASEEAFRIYGIEYKPPFLLSLDSVQKSVFIEYRGQLDIAIERVVAKKSDYDEKFKLINNKTGKERFVHSRAKLVVDEEGNAKRLVGTIQDITDNKRAEAEIVYLGYHDKLTGLYNRAFFEEEIMRLSVERQLPLSVIIGDINGLKLINDGFGHELGDRLIIEIARILKKCCREEDIIARVGGDEFCILLPKSNYEIAQRICNSIYIECQEREKVCKDELHFVSVSLGHTTRTSAHESIDTIIKEAEAAMYKHKLLESRSLRSSIVSSIISTLHERYIETEEHSNRAKQLSRDIGIALGISDSMLDDLELLALLHDVGKIAISDTLINKNSELTQKEWDEMKRHPEIGYQITQSTIEFQQISEYILTHHEKWDGSGYPQQLKGEEIPLPSRIIAVVDAYDAMINDRPYRDALTQEQAIREIKENAGTQFDPNIAKVFIEKVLGQTW